MEKEKLVQIIKDWVKLDNEMRTLQRELNIRKLEKKEYNKSRNGDYEKQ